MLSLVYLVLSPILISICSLGEEELMKEWDEFSEEICFDSLWDIGGVKCFPGNDTCDVRSFTIPAHGKCDVTIRTHVPPDMGICTYALIHSHFFLCMLPWTTAMGAQNIFLLSKLLGQLHKSAGTVPLPLKET